MFKLQKPLLLSALLFFACLTSAWSSTPTELLETGVDLWYGKKKPKEAIPYFDQAIAKDPKFTRAYLCRAGAYESLNNNTAAFQDYDKAVKVAPHYANSYELRGYLHYRLGHFKEAEGDLNQAQKWFNKVKDADSTKRVGYTQGLIVKRLATAKAKAQYQKQNP
jgi:tetratricopeptide (TPR) repeat protein